MATAAVTVLKNNNNKWQQLSKFLFLFVQFFDYKMQKKKKDYLN